jgi:hypothetical protein
MKKSDRKDLGPDARKLGGHQPGRVATLERRTLVLLQPIVVCVAPKRRKLISFGR